MSLDLDPVYHTTTMVKILSGQGCTQHAMELAEAILAQHGENAEVRRILEELKTEAKQAFERFKSGGRSAGRDSASPQERTAEENEEEGGTEGELREPIRLTLVADSPESPETSSVARLQELLQRIERNRIRP
jgi:hypothetical protein